MSESESSVGQAPHNPGASRPRLRVYVLLALFLLAASFGGWWGIRAFQRHQALQQASLGNFPEAAAVLQRLFDRSPDDLAVAKALARGHLEAGDKLDALPPLDAWCRLASADPEPFRLRMELHRAEHRFAPARDDGLRLLELTSESDLVLPLAGLCFSAGDFEQAEKLARRAIREQPTHRPARRLLAQALSARGKKQQAADLLDELLREQPNDTAALFARGVLAVEMNDTAHAITLLEVVRARDPQRQRTVRAQLVLAYTQAGRTEDARIAQSELHALQEVEVLRDALQSQPNDPDLQARVARALFAAAQTEQALLLLDQTLKALPNHPATHRTLAEHYDRIGEKGLAAKHRRLADAPPRGEQK